MASATSTNSKIPSHRRNGAGQGDSSPLLSIASVVVGAAGLACGYFVSWLACIVFGIAAAVLGIVAHRKQSSLSWLAKVGIILGIGCIVASFALVAIVSFQMVRLGLV